MNRMLLAMAVSAAATALSAAASPVRPVADPGGGPASAGSACPDMGVEFIEGKTVTEGSQDCATGEIDLTVSWEGVELSYRPRHDKCPLFTWIYPPHYDPVFMKGWMLESKSTVPIELITWDCEEHTFLFIFHVRYECIIVNRKNCGAVVSWSAVPCPPEEPN
ncbi:MAG: hypothetical protein AB1486_00615 [Planctomycetota bacterium]